MTAIKERTEAVRQVSPPAPPRRKGLWGLALLIAAVVAVGIGWLAFGGSDDDTVIEDEVTSAVEEVDLAVSPPPNGRYVNREGGFHTLRLNDDGTYEASSNGFPISGTYAIEGDLYTELTHDLSSQPESPATYRWTFEGSELTFEPEGVDNIGGRRTFYDRTFVFMP